MAKATCTKCRACAQNQAVKLGPGSSRPRKLNDVSHGMTTFGRRQPRGLDPTPGPRNLNENPARRAFGKKQEAEKTIKTRGWKNKRLKKQEAPPARPPAGGLRPPDPPMAPPPPATPRDPRRPPATPATPGDINIGANMDRTIHYFQDRTEWKNAFSNISRIIDNVADSNFQYFQDRTE